MSDRYRRWETTGELFMGAAIVAAGLAVAFYVAIIFYGFGG